MMKRLTLKEYLEQAKAQGVPRDHVAHVCPMCGTIQSATDLIQAGAGKNLDDVERYEGWSCIGRWKGAGQPRKKRDGKPCNWTLGGFFQVHKLEILTPDGKTHPRFELAAPDQARLHYSSRELCGTK